MPNDSQILTTIGQTPIVRSLVDLEKRAADFRPSMIWQSIRAFYCTTLPPDCVIDCEALFKEVTEKLSQLQTFNCVDILFSEFETVQRQEDYLQAKNLELLAQMRNSLYVHGYVKIDFSAHPLIERRGKLTVPNE